MRKRKLGVTAVLVAVVLASCGGSTDETGGDSGSATTTAADSAQSDQSETTTSTEADQGSATVGGDIGDHFDTEGGTAVVTIGDDRWEFELVEGHPIANCDADFFGGFVAILTNAGADIANPSDLLSVMLPGGSFTDPPAVEVKLEASGDAEWIADETIYEQNADLPAGLGVTEFAIDGTSAAGSALFFEQESFYQFNAGTGDLVVEQGTFTITCASGE